MWNPSANFWYHPLPPGSLTIIAGRPGMGCTSLARQFLLDKCLLLDLAQLRKEESGQPVLEPPVFPTVTEVKALAVKLGVPAIVTCSLQREIEERPDARPAIEDFLDAHGTEAVSSADTIVLLYRAAYYEEEPWKSADFSAEIYVVKNAFGPTGTIYCRWMRDLEHRGILFYE